MAGFSEKDGVVTVVAKIPGRSAKLVIYGPKDPEFDPGDSAAQNGASGRVIFISHGVRKPIFKFSMVNGVEGAKLRAMCTYNAGNRQLGYWPLTITWAFRRPGVGSLSYHFEDAELGKGGAPKASDGAGFEGGAFEFPMLSASYSTNGGSLSLIA